MANSKIFASANHTTRRAALADTRMTVNAAGGQAYAASDEAALAQMVVTGTFSDTFYTSASTQLNQMLHLLNRVSPYFVAQLAVYGRRQAFMKDTPAFLLAWLAKNNGHAFELAFNHVVDDGKMLKNFVQIVRSGVVGKRSLGSQAKRLVAKWIQEASPKRLLSASIGASPSLSDLIRLAHPRPSNPEQEAMFGWLLGKNVDGDTLPTLIRQVQTFRRNPNADVPDVPFQLLTSMELSTKAWAQVCERSTWQQLRMNLNTFNRHGVFNDRSALLSAAERLQSPQEIERSKVFPFQLLAAALNLDVTGSAGDALQKGLFGAMEMACGNIPEWEGQSVGVLMDVSGSMTTTPVTGSRKGAPPSKVMSAHAAGLFAAVIARRNPGAHVIGFHTVAKAQSLPKHATLKKVYESLSFPGGGTNCACGLEYLLRHQIKLDNIVMLSDNESHRSWNSGRGTKMTDAWLAYKAFHPKAKMVCVDFAPNTTVQVPDMHDVMNVGGFTDDVFRVADRFFKGQAKQAAKGNLSLVADIKAIALEELAVAA